MTLFKVRVDPVSACSLPLTEEAIGHRDMYFQRLVLQRDISVANILIVPYDNSVEKTRGVLIDLDHVKKAKKRISYPASTFQIKTKRQNLIKMNLEEYNHDLSDDLTAAYVLRFPNDYGTAYFTMNSLLTRRESSLFLGENIEKVQKEQAASIFHSH